MARFRQVKNYDGRPILKDVQLNVIVNALWLSREFVDLIREGYSQESFYGDEGE
jgi:hypothetical protein